MAPGYLPVSTEKLGRRAGKQPDCMGIRGFQGYQEVRTAESALVKFPCAREGSTPGLTSRPISTPRARRGILFGNIVVYGTADGERFLWGIPQSSPSSVAATAPRIARYLFLECLVALPAPHLSASVRTWLAGGGAA